MNSDPLALRQEHAEEISRSRQRALRILELEAEVRRYKARLELLRAVLSQEEVAAI